ncbi:hypothetical protein HY416_01055 [Candidatus Kaiserbacteria bacterium]|nr:hypothetical protein [Candidatus Kaiserbacteria bacterium]
MKKTVVSVIGVASMYLLPAVAFARFEQITDVLESFIDVLNTTLVPLIFALAFLLFLWGMFKYFFWGGGEEEKREEGKQLMLWAIIAFLLMVSIWGIVNVLSSGFGFNDDTLEQLPKARTQSI